MSETIDLYLIILPDLQRANNKRLEYNALDLVKTL